MSIDCDATALNHNNKYVAHSYHEMFREEKEFFYVSTDSFN